MLRLVLGAFIALAFSASASAAFTFSLSPSSVTVGGLGSSSFNVNARYIDLGDAGPNNLGTLSLNLLQTNSNFTLSSLSVGGTHGTFANLQTKTVGVINVTHVGPGTSTIASILNVSASNGAETFISGAFGSVTLTAVPEPGSLAFVSLVGFGLLRVRRQRTV